MKFNRKAYLALSLTAALFIGQTQVLADTKAMILDARAKIQTITGEIKTREETISRLDSQLIDLSVEIQETQDKLGEIKVQIQMTQDAITQKTVQRDEKQAQLGKRLRSAYKSGGVSWLRALIDAENLADFFVTTKVLKEIAQSDQAVIGELETLNQELAATKAQLTLKETDTAALLAKLDTQSTSLNKALADQEANLTAVSRQKNELASLVQGKEIELFAEIRDTLTDRGSSIEELKNARVLLAQLEEFVETAEAERLASRLDQTSETILEELETAKAAREVARLAALEDAREAARIEEARAAAKRAEEEREAQAAEARRLRAEELAARTKPSTKPATKPATIPATKPATSPITQPTTQPAPKPVVSAGTTIGLRALAEAKTYLGVPYVYGGASYSGVDCSGFTMRAYAQAGISIPRTATAQYRASRRISRSELKPGDLIFWGFGSEITHVAMYVGNGLQIHAPRPGKSVCIVKMFGSMDYIGAGRPY